MALVKPFANKLTRTIIAIVNVPIARFAGLANDLAATSPPPKFWIPTGINANPITVIKDPVTTGGKNSRNRANKPAIKNTKTPAEMVAPYIAPIPNVPPILIKGDTDWIAEPNTTGIAIPVRRVLFSCSNVPIPVIKISAEIKYAICCRVKCSAAPINNGTRMPPEYMANTCCKPNTSACSLLAFTTGSALTPATASIINNPSMCVATTTPNRLTNEKSTHSHA